MTKTIHTSYVIGIDYGSDSARAIVVDSATGAIVSRGVAYYSRWKSGLYQHPSQAIFRQHPQDYLDALEECVKTALSPLSQEQIDHIVGIGIDTTGSTPAPVDRAGVPLALKPEFQDCEDAMFHLWKDHCAQAEAEELDNLFRTGGTRDYTVHQGKYSAEWFWAKILRTVRHNPDIRREAWTWIEHCDWMIGLLTGNTDPEHMYHSACAAGHKALWHSDWNGLPEDAVLEQADPYLCLVKARYGRAPEAAMTRAGSLCPEWARRLGLKAGIAVSGSSFDAHAGAVGAGIRPGTMVCTIGTSAVDMVVAKAETLEGEDLRRFGGKAENSILPGYIGIETGQAAFGDIFAWYKRLLMWPVEQAKACLPPELGETMGAKLGDDMLRLLEAEAQKRDGTDFPVALDWFNGRRYPDTDDLETAAISGLSLGTDAVDLYRGIVFGAVCGLKRIVSGFLQAGIKIDDLIAVGGISQKSDYIMQLIADMVGMQLSILDADQTCAIGAAMYAAIAAGIYGDADQAAEKMAARKVRTFRPDGQRKAAYEAQYQNYLRLAGAKTAMK